jgi:hypothetical protein
LNRDWDLKRDLKRDLRRGCHGLDEGRTGDGQESEGHDEEGVESEGHDLGNNGRADDDCEEKVEEECDDDIKGGKPEQGKPQQDDGPHDDLTVQAKYNA